MQTYVMKKEKHFFSNATINRKWHMDKGRTTTSIQKTPTTQNRQYNSTKQHTNSTRVPTKIFKLCLIQARLGTYIYQKERWVLKTFL